MESKLRELYAALDEKTQGLQSQFEIAEKLVHENGKGKAQVFLHHNSFRAQKGKKKVLVANQREDGHIRMPY